MKEDHTLMEKIVSLAKRRGFVFQGSEIYGGIAGMFDYGPLGVELMHNITDIWWNKFVYEQDNVYGLDAAILMHPKAWEASGHVGGFSDQMVECKKCKKRFREDHVKDECPLCKGDFGEVRQFNMMFKTNVGVTEDESSVTYFRPETAGGIFMNFKNVMDSMHPKLPFGIAQIGKAFRNEIAPRDFIFRLREMKQMEVEYFVKEEDWENAFSQWQKSMHEYAEEIGIKKDLLHELEVGDNDRAHYSKRTIDFEFDFPFGRKELWGLAYRSDHDLVSHAGASGVDLTYLDRDTNDRITPHVVEPSLGVDRTVLAVLVSAYREDEIGDEKRVYLAFKPSVAPIKAAVFPLMKNKPELQEKARRVYKDLKKVIPQIMFDDNGNVGKRYRRQDEIGTPFCITIDFDTLEDNTVTVRHRDTAAQERISIEELDTYIKKQIEA